LPREFSAGEGVKGKTENIRGTFFAPKAAIILGHRAWRNEFDGDQAFSGQKGAGQEFADRRTQASRSSSQKDDFHYEALTGVVANEG
jgi:hypothetical protein